MKRFLLIPLLAATSLLNAQDVTTKSAFGDGEGVDGTVNAIVVQKDGKIVIGGRFASVNGVPRANIARINADGTLDRTFTDTIESGVNGQVFALTIDSTGAIIAGGLFTQAASTEVLNLARFKTDGSLDKNFGGVTTGQPGANGEVLALGTQPDGKIVVGGSFSSVFGQPRHGIARLNSDTTLDGPVVSQDALSGTVRAVGSSPQDDTIAGGLFTMQGQIARSLIRVGKPD